MRTMFSLLAAALSLASAPAFAQDFGGVPHGFRDQLVFTNGGATTLYAHAPATGSYGQQIKAVRCSSVVAASQYPQASAVSLKFLYQHGSAVDLLGVSTIAANTSQSSGATPPANLLLSNPAVAGAVPIAGLLVDSLSQPFQSVAPGDAFGVLIGTTVSSGNQVVCGVEGVDFLAS